MGVARYSRNYSGWCINLILLTPSILNPVYIFRCFVAHSILSQFTNVFGSTICGSNYIFFFCLFACLSFNTVLKYRGTLCRLHGHKYAKTTLGYLPAQPVIAIHSIVSPWYLYETQSITCYRELPLSC